MSQMNIPLRERQGWPRLSETLPHMRHPDVCQSCGAVRTSASEAAASGREHIGAALIRWQEHDEWDRPEPIHVVLCEPCSDALIEPHPRLYDPKSPYEPIPGTMPLCAPCTHRDGLVCREPRLTANGGPGLPITFPHPSTCFIDGIGKDGRRFGRVMTQYQPGPIRCEGLTTAEQPADTDGAGG